MTDFIGFAYALTVAAGGIVGYMKAGSVPSLVAGVTSGALLCLGAYNVSNDPKNVAVSLATSVVLSGLMGYRFYNSGKFMPAGMVAALSLVMALRYGYRTIEQ